MTIGALEKKSNKKKPPKRNDFAGVGHKTGTVEPRLMKIKINEKFKLRKH